MLFQSHIYLTLIRSSVHCSHCTSSLPLGATAQGDLWPPEQSASIFLYSEADCLVSQQFRFCSVRSATRPTANLEVQGIPLRLARTL
jgi:hypothetical protein